MDKIIQEVFHLLRWCIDIEEGEFISSPTQTPDHIELPGTYSREIWIGEICRLVNEMIKIDGYPFRILYHDYRIIISRDLGIIQFMDRQLGWLDENEYEFKYDDVKGWEGVII